MLGVFYRTSSSSANDHLQHHTVVGLTFCFRLKHRSQARLFFCGGWGCDGAEELGLPLARAGFGFEIQVCSPQSVAILECTGRDRLLMGNGASPRWTVGSEGKSGDDAALSDIIL